MILFSSYQILYREYIRWNYQPPSFANDLLMNP